MKIYSCIKRFLDIIFSSIALVLLSPLFFVLAIVVKLSTPGPVFYKHKRIGYKGKPIYILKFRSMYDGADDNLKIFTPEQLSEWEENFKVENDPRITPVGRFLRSTSLDELPQLLDILKGTLSIVGPRPIVDKELLKYGSNKDKLLSVKPGLTGYWACHGRSNIPYDERMAMELYYVDHMSFILDVEIVLKTIKAVLVREGAK